MKYPDFLVFRDGTPVIEKIVHDRVRENSRGGAGYSPVRKWGCAHPECSSETMSWFADGWFATGFRVSDNPFETVDARRKLEDAGLIEENDLSVALICPEHAPEMYEHLRAEMVC